MIPEGLVCLRDKQPLIFNEPAGVMECQECLQSYSVEDEIVIFLNAEKIHAQVEEQREIYHNMAKSAKLLPRTFLDNPILVNHVARKSYIDKVELKPSSRILELGTQFGDHLIYLSRKYSYCPKQNFYGMDIVLSGLKLAKARLPELNYINCDISKLPFKDNYFDVVIFCGILEHLSDPRPILGEISRVMKKGGVLVAYYVVKDYKWTLQYLLVDILKCKGFTYKVTEAIGHDFKIIKVFDEYQRDFSANGLKLIRGERTNAILQPLCDTILIKLMILASLFKKYLCMLVNNWRIRKSCVENNRFQTSKKGEISSVEKEETIIKKIFSFLVRILYYLLCIERVIFKKVGVSFLGLYKRL